MKVRDLTSQEFEKRPGGYLRSVLFNSKEFNDDLRVQHVKVPPGQTIKPHYHDNRTEVFLILKGGGTLKVDGQEVSGNTKLVLCEPGDIHEADNTDGVEDFEILVFRNGTDEEDMNWIEDNDD